VEGERVFLVRFRGTRPGLVAMINAWILAPNADDALIRARREIEKNGWLVGELDEMSSPIRGCAGQQYYEQALIDREVLVIYQAPADGAEDE